MAANSVKGTFALNITTGNQTVDTGVGVTLKALILWGTKQTADGFAASNYSFIGLATASTERACVAWGADDAQASPIISSGYSSVLCINYYNDATTPTVEATADFVDFTTGGAGRFTINVTDAPAAADLVHYLAFYGTDITNAKVLPFTAMLTPGGNRSDTGFGFQGNFLFSIGRSNNSVGNAVRIANNIGCAVSSSQRTSMFWGARDTHAASEKHYSDNTKCMSFSNNVGGLLDAAADFTAFNSDGYELNWTDFAANAWPYSSLVIKGGQWEIDEILAPTSTGNQDITTAFDPTGVLIFGTGQTTANATVGAECHVCIGGSDGTTEGHTWGVEDDVSANTDANMRTDTTKVIGVATHPSTVAAEADLTLGTLKYTLGWTTTRLNSRFFGVAMGSDAAGGAPASTNQLMLTGAGP